MAPTGTSAAAVTSTNRYGGDPEVAGAPNLGPLTEAPFYTVQVLAGTVGTKGGPVTDAVGAVLTAAGTPINGLYAAGNAAAFWTGDAYPGPGTTLGIAMTMGYPAGRHAATPPRRHAAAVTTTTTTTPRLAS